MWTNEFGLGTTVYFDHEKKWHMSGTALYEIHAGKQGVDQTVGGIMTIEGGLGRIFPKGYASAGAAYFGQWKVTADIGTGVPPIVAWLKGSMVGSHRNWICPFVSALSCLRLAICSTSTLVSRPREIHCS
jgi:hypothetical protein